MRYFLFVIATFWAALAHAQDQPDPRLVRAADEVAVEAFLQQRIRFDQIHALNVATLAAVQPSNPDTLHALLALDAETRAVAQELAQRLN